MLFLIPLLSFLSLVNSKKVNGNLSSGPLGQGNCSVQSNESDIFNCSNGASCVYDGLESTFECTGGGSSPLDGLKDNNDNSRGPPGRSDCHSHGSHFDCDDGSFCEQINVKLFYIQIKFLLIFDKFLHRVYGFVNLQQVKMEAHVLFTQVTLMVIGKNIYKNIKF